MKTFNFIFGALLIWFGAVALFGTMVMISSATSRYPLYINLLNLLLLGATPFAIGIVLWLKSGTLRNSKSMWCLIGFFASWFMWSTVAHVRMRPKDVTTSWSKELRDTMPKDYLKAMQSAYCFGVGRWKIVASASHSNHFAIITPIDDGFPKIYILNNGTNGTSISLQDSDRQIIDANDRNGDNVFDWYGFSTGWSSNDFSVTDLNLDGQFDVRMGPGRNLAFNINSNWYTAIRTNNKKYVKIDGKLKRIGKFRNGWTFKDDK